MSLEEVPKDSNIHKCFNINAFILVLCKRLMLDTENECKCPGKIFPNLNMTLVKIGKIN